MAERVGIVIHWLGLLVGILGGIYFIDLINNSPRIPFNLEAWIWLFFILLIPLALAWFIRWIIVGKVKFFPWQSNPKD